MILSNLFQRRCMLLSLLPSLEGIFQLTLLIKLFLPNESNPWESFILPLHFGRCFLKLLIFFLGKKTQILAVTQKGYEESKKYFPSTFYMPACINPERFLNKKYKLSRTLRFFCVSKYQKRKNLPILIEALETLIKKYPHLRFHLTIIGTAWSKGPINKHLLPEKKVYDDLLALLQQKKLEQNISLLKDVPYDDMPRHYADADLFVFPASQEPLGYALVEAMATGLPILCSTEVGAKCYVHSDMNGSFFSIYF